MTEVEAVLRITKPVATLVQTEIHYTSAFGYVLKKNALDLLRSEYLSVVDLEKVGVKKSLVSVDRPVMELTSVGQTTRARAQLEFERRFCGNTTNMQARTHARTHPRTHAHTHTHAHAHAHTYTHTNHTRYTPSVVLIYSPAQSHRFSKSLARIQSRVLRVYTYYHKISNFS